MVISNTEGILFTLLHQFFNVKCFFFYVIVNLKESEEYLCCFH